MEHICLLDIVVSCLCLSGYISRIGIGGVLFSLSAVNGLGVLYMFGSEGASFGVLGGNLIIYHNFLMCNIFELGIYETKYSYQDCWG